MFNHLSEKKLQSLLYQSESTFLDFKREQYRFTNATPDDKSKLLKDILAFANSWRETEAYILIGVEEKTGEKNKIVGCENHFDDAQLQEFVNGKTNKKVILSYEVYPIKDKKINIGIIRIAKQQRPIYIKKKFGIVEKEKVYFRLGSSNTEANPQDIYNMGKDDMKLDAPILDLQFVDVKNKTKLGKSLQLNLIAFDEPISELSDAFISRSISEHKDYLIENKNYWRELEEFIRLKNLLYPIQFKIDNKSDVLAQNIHIEIIDTSVNIISVISEDDFPKEPNSNDLNNYIPDMSSLLKPKTKKVFIDITHTDWKLKIDVGDVKAQETVYTDIVLIGAKETIDLKLKAKIYGNNLPEPQIFDLNINFEIEKKPSLTIKHLEKRYKVDPKIQSFP